jgi:hypothetical protein
MPDPTKANCPYLGLKQDRKSLIGYPSTGNFCFHCKSPAVPQLEHQEAFCLGAAYTECPVFSVNEKHSFPPNLRAVIARSPAGNSDIPRNLGILFVAFVALVLGWHYRGLITSVSGISMTPFPTINVVTITPEPTDVLEPLIVSGLDLPTETPGPTVTVNPTVTPVVDQKHALETPILVDGNQFIIHKVVSGENFDILIHTYNTSLDVIRSLNYQLPTSLWVNLPVVLLPGVTSVHPDLPAFEVFMVTDAAVNIDDLATQKKFDPSLVRKYNNCLNGCILHSGDWVMLPH